MLNQIQNAIIDRLHQGLGCLVTDIKVFFGGLENKDAFINKEKKPAVLLTLNQAHIKIKSSERQRFELIANFYVVCVNNEINDSESLQNTNINDLIYAVLRLLSGQRLNEHLNSLGLQPKSVRPVFFNPPDANSKDLNIYAIEFEAGFDIYGLESDQYPEYTNDVSNPDYLFSKFNGSHSEPHAPFTSLTVNIEEIEN
ncbi:phage protein Gp37 [Snodgrassella sp. CS2]|uniref:phage protein Gp37 n=1 Tax=Snodgrassella sp. CS2 TaxID=3418953 RepID=UPI003D08EAD1